ncbi:MAG TPA: alanine--tRNA ligase [Candidatus Saccharimonadia bacterium]|jgi:alanyl-tRNA synthetase|nr:alanine--tRNA ligase [Candidatus Saccharimonadia bacterium]
MTAQDIRNAYLKFFADRGHVIIPRANIVPKEDATTLFTGSGMQPMIPYLLGATHPDGVRIVDSQVCLRAEDIDEVGDNRHTTSFEMLGNWSLGDYFKKEQVPWMWEFLTQVVKLDPKKLYITCFIGEPKYDIPKDTEAADLWEKLFAKAGIEAKIADIGSEADGYKRGIKDGERIFYYDSKKNWWSRNGGPETTPVGDPCGPDSEMFYDFGTEHDPSFGEHCHPNCDCGRFMEIGNNVFMAYKKIAEGKFEPLAKPNIDHGSGLERIAAASLGNPDVFKISLMWPIIEKLQELSGKKYEDNLVPMRVIADHLRAATFMATDGVVPSNTDQGYVMRRFIRRAIRQAHSLGLRQDFLQQVVPVITSMYKDDFPEVAAQVESIVHTLVREEHQFRATLDRGVKEFEKLVGGELTGDIVFTLFDTYGFPSELSLEEAGERGITVAENWKHDFDHLLKEQKDRSRTATVGQFKGGLGDHSEMSIKYHTATHLMYKALRLVLGDHVIQRGSNITPERLRFDFSHDEKMTPEQIAKVEQIVNENIAKDWPMGFREIPTDQAFKEGALGAFGDKYGETVKVYTAGDPMGEWYSKEICGGPHVTHTGTLAEGGVKFKIKKEESSSAGIRRVKAVLE